MPQLNLGARTCKKCGHNFNKPIRKELDQDALAHAEDVKARTRQSVNRVASAIEKREDEDREKSATGLSCPKCGSRQTGRTASSVVKKATAIAVFKGFGLLAKTDRQCAKCGFAWRP